MRALLPLLALATALFGCRHGAHGPIEDEPDPGVEAAECCLAPKRWEASDAGWASWRVDSLTLEPGKYERFPVALTKGLTYRFEACGAPGVTDLDLLLYDAEGEIVVRDGAVDREPLITYTAAETGTRTLVVYLRETEGGRKGPISWGWASYAGN